MRGRMKSPFLAISIFSYVFICSERKERMTAYGKEFETGERIPRQTQR
jgi:hypothetical protein